jgi:hypothetical protein
MLNVHFLSLTLHSAADDTSSQIIDWRDLLELIRTIRYQEDGLFGDNSFIKYGYQRYPQASAKYCVCSFDISAVIQQIFLQDVKL